MRLGNVDIINLLEKFKISIKKKYEYQELIDEFVQKIEAAADESKVSIIEFREIIEDKEGIKINDSLYDQFLLYFDLDRNGKVYITSFCEFMREKSAKTINFFKVNQSVIVHKIADYVKNRVESTFDCIMILEEEFKKEIWKNHQLDVQRKRGR